MAHLNWHGRIVRTWSNKHSNLKVHLTETNWLIKTTGPRLGGAKVLARPKEEEKRATIMHKLSDTENWLSELVY